MIVGLPTYNGSTGAAPIYGPSVLFENLIDAKGLTVSSTYAGAPENMLSDDTFSGWTCGGNVNAYFVADWGDKKTFNALAFAAHDLGTMGARISLTAWNDGLATPDWSPIYYGSLQVTDDRPLVIYFPPAYSQAVRCYITFSAAYVRPTINVMRIGNLLTFPTDIAEPYTPGNFAGKSEVYQPASLGGAFFQSRVKRLGGKMQPQLNPMPRAWVNANIAGFRDHYDAGKPFFWAGSPYMMPDDVAFARRAEGAEELRPRYHGGAQLASIGLELDCHGS